MDQHVAPGVEGPARAARTVRHRSQPPDAEAAAVVAVRSDGRASTVAFEYQAVERVVRERHAAAIGPGHASQVAGRVIAIAAAADVGAALVGAVVQPIVGVAGLHSDW